MNRKISLLLTALALLTTQLWAANEKETVEQVATAVTLSGDVDYVITSDTPFGDEGVVNIENTEHAVLILSAVKPSKATRLLASHVQINGQKAVNNNNCQVKLYNRGCIIMPYDKNMKPLTVFSEQNFEGEQCNDFGLESTGGFMNTLSDEKLNNRIRSFKLKRGYMVTFSLRAGGRGYSRCFIAADEDLEMATLPAILDQSISSYRVFEWYDAGKPQLAAAGGDKNACTALNVTSTYTWSAGSSMLPDVECVSHHIYEDWPSAAACGNVSYTCHMKTNNEPRNSADDHPQDLTTILNNWENLMATGLRLCSPSSWDGSDYWNGTGFLKTFFDSIDARGWRCDIVDMHCYWAESNFPNLKNWVNAVHRPIWISEWCWGASWNNNGAFASGVTETQVRDALKRICNTLNGMDYVERYFYWNSERDPSRIYKSGKLTPAGEMYSQLDGGLAYNGKYDYVPKAPKQQDPKDLVIDFNKEKGTIDFMWYEYNGEMNEYIRLECRKGDGNGWTTAMEITGIEQEGLHIFRGVEARMGWEFRIHEKDANGKERSTNIVMAASSDMQAGDAIEIDGKTWYLGGNLLSNGHFDMGFQGWTNGTGAIPGQPWFQVVPVGGSDGGSYLQCYGSGSLRTEEALRADVSLEAGANYYFSADVANNPNVTSRLALSSDGEALDSAVARPTNSGANWQTLFSTFNSGRFDKGILSLSNLASKAQFDNIMLCRLYDIWNIAVIEGVKQEEARTKEAINYLRPQLGLALQQHLDSIYDPDLFPPGSQKRVINYLHSKTNEALRSQRLWPELELLLQQATSALSYQFTGHEELATLVDATNALLAIDGALPSTDIITKSYDKLKAAINEFMPMTVLTDKVQSPSFTTSTGWRTKAGTYKDGDQRVSTLNGVSFWNAWWNLPLEGNESETMAIRQEITGLSHGLYAVECQAATEHFCLSNQHAYISNGTDSVASPTLTANYLDLPGMADSLRWQTLVSQPVYVDEDGTVSIGFESSKQGATDLAWREVGKSNSRGDHREGWWGATNFRLRFHPLFKPEPTGSEWGVVCLPYAVNPVPDVQYFQIAAITSDYKNLCLEPIGVTEPGVPFIYRSASSSLSLPEFGEAVSKTTDAPGNLRGFFKTSVRVPIGYYVLTEGKWSKLAEGSERPRMKNFSAIIRPLNDKQSQPIPVVDSWAGATMPIEGITDEEIASGIDTPSVARSQTGSTAVFDLQGRSIQAGQQHKGLSIQVKNGKATKIIK